MIKSVTLIAGMLALAAPLAVAETSTWAVDPAHSTVEFSVRHMGISNVHGRFAIAQGNVNLNDADATKSNVQVTIDTSSLDTGVAQRDTHLKSPDFFETAKYPTATFTSTGVEKNGNHLTVNGNLTLHGVTRPVALDVDGPTAPVPGMDKKPHAGFSASTTISRKDFGIGPNFPAAMLGDDIKLTIEVEVARQ